MLRLLVIEDDVDLLECSSELMSRQGFDVVLASNHQQARDLMAAPVDVCLMDLHVDGRLSYDLIREIRQTNPRACIVIATGSFDHDIELACRQQGADAFIVKPYPSQILLQEIVRILLIRGISHQSP